MAATDEEWERAYALVGKFMGFWAVVEGGVNKIIKAALKLDMQQGYIVTANISVRDKIFICRTAVSVNTTRTEDWREWANKVLIRVSDCSVHRNVIAHNMFGPHEDGGVEFLRVIAKGKFALPNDVWSEDRFAQTHVDLLKLRADLETIETDLRNPPSYADFLAVMDNPLGAAAGPPARGLLSAARRQRQSSQSSQQPNEQSWPEAPDPFPGLREALSDPLGSLAPLSPLAAALADVQASPPPEPPEPEPRPPRKAKRARKGK